MPPRREDPTSRTTITLPEDVRRAIGELAAKNDRNLSAEITRALREYIERECGEKDKPKPRPWGAV